MYTIIALVRFSHLTNTGKGHRLTRGKSLEHRAELLFNARRMAQRFELFRRMCLPSLVCQQNGKFGAVILASEMMPTPLKRELRQLLAPYPNIREHFAPASDNLSALFSSQFAHFAPLNEYILTCRLDDDDSLSNSYTEQALKYVNSAYYGCCLSFPWGLIAERQFGEVTFREHFAPLIAAGLGSVERADSGRTIYDYGDHTRIWKRVPTMIDARSCQYLVARHGGNDSAEKKHPYYHMARIIWRRVKSALGIPLNSPMDLEEARERFPDFESLYNENWQAFIEI